MPASMTMALVASSPNVTGSRMEMPASGPMPGSMPTSVPTRQPRKAYHSIPGCSATEKPRIRLWTVSNSEPQHAALERRAQRLAKEPVGEEREADRVHGGREGIAPLDDDQQEEYEERHGDEEAQRPVCGHRRGGDEHHQRGVVAVAPVEGRQWRTARGAGHHQRPKQDHEAGDDLRHHAGAGCRQAAEGQVAADREYHEAERDEDRAGDVISFQPWTFPIDCTADSTRFASSSQNFAKSGASR